MRQIRAYEQLINKLIPGQAYRRSDLAQYSSNIDRHLALLLQQGLLRKVSHGLYAAPKTTVFGEPPPDEYSLLHTFLKDNHFVVYSPSQFNTLGLGTTQLYNRRIVFNRKRVGELQLGSRTYTFHRWREAPKELSPEFLVVECLNRLDELAEDREQILNRLKLKLPELNRRRLNYAALHYGTLATQKKLKDLITENLEAPSLE